MRQITETHTGKIITDTDLNLEYLYVGVHNPSSIICFHRGERYEELLI